MSIWQNVAAGSSDEDRAWTPGPNQEVTGDVGKSSFGGAVGPKPDWSGSKRGGEERDGQLSAEFACKVGRERELEREVGQKGLFLAGRNGSMCSC